MITLLAHAHALLASPQDAEDTPERSAAALVVGLAGAAAFGTVLGSLHDPRFLLSAALKLPLVLVLPFAVTAPTLHWLHAAEGGAVPWSTVAARCATVIGRIGLFLLIPLPLVWLLWQGSPTHGAGVLIGAVAFAAALAAALWRTQLLPTTRLRRLAAVALLAAAFGQTAWILRPWIGAPGADFAWLLPPRGHFAMGLLDPLYVDEVHIRRSGGVQ